MARIAFERQMTIVNKSKKHTSLNVSRNNDDDEGSSPVVDSGKRSIEVTILEVEDQKQIKENSIKLNLDEI